LRAQLRERHFGLSEQDRIGRLEFIQSEMLAVAEVGRCGRRSPRAAACGFDCLAFFATSSRASTGRLARSTSPRGEIRWASFSCRVAIGLSKDGLRDCGAVSDRELRKICPLAIVSRFVAAFTCRFLVSLARAADKTPARQRRTSGRSTDAIAEAIFRKADRKRRHENDAQRISPRETLIEQVALSMPAKTVAKNAKQSNPQAAALGAPAAATPDFSNGKHLTLDEFKAAYPVLLAQAEVTLAQLRAQASKTAKKN